MNLLCFTPFNNWNDEICLETSINNYNKPIEANQLHFFSPYIHSFSSYYYYYLPLYLFLPYFSYYYNHSCHHSLNFLPHFYPFSIHNLTQIHRSQETYLLQSLQCLKNHHQNSEICLEIHIKPMKNSPPFTISWFKSPWFSSRSSPSTPLE